jgi:hypothetical protein
VVCWFPLVPAQAASPSPHAASRPFAVGERFTYALSWLGIRAGTAVLEVAEASPIQGRAALRFLTTATSSPVVTKFYPVDNRVESLVDAEQLLPYRMWFRRREGKRHNDFDVTFDHAKGLVTATKDGVTDQLPLPPQTFDSISCLYYVRNLPSLAPGLSMMFNVHHDKKTYKLEVRVEGVEKITGPWGTVEAVRVLAIMPFQGIFLNQGNIQVWITNDAKRVPVMMKARVIIGSVVARLIEGFQPPRAMR